MRSVRPFVAALVVALGALARFANAADGDSRTTFESFVYVWGEGMYGDADTPRGETSTDVPFSDLIDHANVAVMARGRLESGRFSLVGDVEYTDLESDRRSRTIRLGPQGGLKVSGDAKLKAKTWVGDLSAGYLLFDLEDVRLSPSAELYAGARYWSFSSELDAHVGGNDFDVDETETWVDGLVGARIGLDLSPTVVFGVQGDVGGFGVGASSDFSWMQMTSLTWAFSDTWRLHLAYKFMGFERENGEVEIKQQFRGPVLGVSHRF
jgi:hypothetical protein